MLCGVNLNYFCDKTITQIYFTKNPRIFYKKYKLKIYKDKQKHSLFVINRKKDLHILYKHTSEYSLFISDKRVLLHIDKFILGGAKFLFTDDNELNEMFQYFSDICKKTNWISFLKKHKLPDIIFPKNEQIKCTKKFDINFKHFTNNAINLSFGGPVNNEVVIMENLSKIANVHYNGVLLNDFINNGKLNVHLANKAIQNNTKRIKFTVTFYRGLNKTGTNDIFSELSEPKIYSHNYVHNFWKNSIVGFQTYTSYYLAKHKKLGKLGCDGTLDYNDKMIKPKQYFIRYQFMDTHNYGKYQENLKKKFGADFLVCVSGLINNNNFPETLISVITELREEYHLNIVLLIMGKKNIDKEKIFVLSKEWIFVDNYDKMTYMQMLKQCDLLVNTWYNKCVIYSGSNKNLDGIVSNIPVVTPFSLSYSEVLGKNYIFYYDSLCERNRKKELKYNIEVVINGNYNKNKLKKIFRYMKKTHNDKILMKYYQQIKKLKWKNLDR